MAHLTAFVLFIHCVTQVTPAPAVQEVATSKNAPSTTQSAVRVVADTSASPESAAWAKTATELVEKWYPMVSKLLASDGYTPPTEVKLVFKKRMRGPAGTSGATIAISAEWIAAHPDDTGMLIHEMTHIVQSYPRYDPVWLVEGLADYVRCFRYEPNAPRPPIDPAQDSYRDGYKVTAAFLAWIERTQDPKIIGKLNAAVRRTEYRYELFEEWTGKSLDRLWGEFLQAETSQPDANRPPG